MAVWVVVSISLVCLCLGYGAACWSTDASHQDLEAELRLLEIENARLKRGNP
jgi:hypothetical protein